ncbi:hypothetical protein ACQ4PT_040828 [Festuca glaucescens]
MVKSTLAASAGRGTRAEKVRRIFDHFDTNGDGVLDRSEMAKHIVAVKPRVKFSEDQISAILDEDFAEELECAVCLADLSDGEAARFLPKCGHGFHAECVDLWLRSHPTCPLCRVDVDKPGALPRALPPVRPERANYGTNLPTNVLFWGSQDTVTAGRTVGGPTSSSGVPTIVIEVPETTSSAVVPRDGDAAKSQGLARLRSIGRLWSSRGRREVGSSSSTGSCHIVTAGAHSED